MRKRRCPVGVARDDADACFTCRSYPWPRRVGSELPAKGFIGRVRLSGGKERSARRPLGPRTYGSAAGGWFVLKWTSARVGRGAGRDRPKAACPLVRRGAAARGAGDGNRTRTVSLGTTRTYRYVLGSLRVVRSRAAWSVPWTPAVTARQWHAENRLYCPRVPACKVAPESPSAVAQHVCGAAHLVGMMRG